MTVFSYAEIIIFCYSFILGLDLDTAISILENIEDYVTINQPPVKPKGGEVFIFIPDSPHEQG